MGAKATEGGDVPRHDLSGRHAGSILFHDVDIYGPAGRRGDDADRQGIRLIGRCRRALPGMARRWHSRRSARDCFIAPAMIVRIVACKHTIFDRTQSHFMKAWTTRLPGTGEATAGTGAGENGVRGCTGGLDSADP
jgi:hypothetical protein